MYDYADTSKSHQETVVWTELWGIAFGESVEGKG